MWRVALWALIAGCYDPTIVAGVPCSERGTCPGGQICDVDTHVCGRSSVDASVDGNPVDGSPDGPACGPHQDLVGSLCVTRIEPVGPTPIGAPGCSTGDANVTHAVGLDRSRRIYVGFTCGATGDGTVVVSTDSARSTALPHVIGTGVTAIAVAGGPPGVGYAATTGSQGISVAVTQDGGASWATQALDTLVSSSNFGVAVAAVNDTVYVAAQVGPGIRVWRNANRGLGAFQVTDVTLSIVFADMVVDPQTGAVWVVGDSPSLHLRKSSDGGATFDPEIAPAPAGTYNYSDWTLGGGAIFVTGSTQTTFTRVPTATPTTSTTPGTMLPAVVTRGRAIAATPDEAVLIANQPSTNALTLQRFAPGATTGTSMPLGTGTHPSILPGPGTSAIYVFTDAATNQLQLGVVAF